MKVITFLGTANYHETTYVYRGATCRTRLFPDALCRFLRPSELLVMVTKDAGAKWLKELETQVAPLGLQPVPINIPEGHSVGDLWEIFCRLTERLEEGDEVVFDITYSFRTLPFLTFLAASYLRVARKVDLKGIYYGAWEARQPPSNPPLPTDLSPVFDLSPFIGLLDWTTATDQFLKTGNAQALAALLPEGELRENIDCVARGLHLLRPLEVLQSAGELPGHVFGASDAVVSAAPPFAALLKRIETDYGALGLSEPTNPANQREFIARLLKIIDWYLAKGQIVHALALAREWLPTRLCVHFYLDPLRLSNRQEMEALLWEGEEGRDSPYWSAWQSVPQRKGLHTLWGPLTHKRNDLLHSGFVHNSESADQIEREAQKLIHQLKSIAGQWKMEEPST